MDRAEQRGQVPSSADNVPTWRVQTLLYRPKELAGAASRFTRGDQFLVDSWEVQEQHTPSQHTVSGLLLV